MINYGNAVLRYCPHLGQNVVMEGKYTENGGYKLECLNKDDCGYREAGCRNRLLPRYTEITEAMNIEAG